MNQPRKNKKKLLPLNLSRILLPFRPCFYGMVASKEYPRTSNSQLAHVNKPGSYGAAATPLKVTVLLDSLQVMDSQSGTKKLLVN
jgi:hypothetical protein